MFEHLYNDGIRLAQKDLVARLRGLASHEHDDVTVAEEAANEIEALMRQIAEAEAYYNP